MVTSFRQPNGRVRYKVLEVVIMWFSCEIGIRRFNIVTVTMLH